MTDAVEVFRDIFLPFDIYGRTYVDGTWYTLPRAISNTRPSPAFPVSERGKHVFAKRSDVIRYGIKSK